MYGSARLHLVPRGIGATVEACRIDDAGGRDDADGQDTPTYAFAWDRQSHGLDV